MECEEEEQDAAEKRSALFKVGTPEHKKKKRSSPD